MRAQHCRHFKSNTRHVNKVSTYQRPDAVGNLEHIMLPLMAIMGVWMLIDIAALYFFGSLNTFNLYLAFAHSILTTLFSFSCVALGQWVFHHRFLGTYIIKLFRRSEDCPL